MPTMQNEKLSEWLRLYFIMGSNNCAKDPLEVLEEAIEGGITLFQFREKGNGALTGASKFRLARKMQVLCKQKGIPFIVNDDVDLAVALEADGVHVGQDDESAEEVRHKMRNKILGVSAHNWEEAQRAVAHGADYLGVGPIFATQTKQDAKAAQGPEIIRSLRQQGIQLPIVGIGGITAENSGSVIEAGADGISVISAISSAEDPIANARELRRIVSQA
ncbi:thiamine phosphate synthase [Brevibacillus ginsengisoli]|uniref:thiamine phosphate synthase n=1 Tax=Brevibacillus ginsengisoli TaxID=363854 RepID=UPI003CEC33C6